MNISQVNELVIQQINQGNEKSFSCLYNSYFTYLCTYATTYILNPNAAKEIVNDVFMNIWYKRGGLTFPIHSYLLRSVQNGCLNYLRSLRTRQRIMDEYRLEILEFQEEFCKNDNNPLQVLEIEDLERQVRIAVDTLPEKCRIIFEKYLYQNQSTQEIADELGIAVTTVRVQIKNALDRIKPQLGSSLGILLIYLFHN